MKIPKSKFQNSKKLQLSKSNFVGASIVVWNLELGFWNFR